MSASYDKAYGDLSPIQRQAVDWNGGAVLVLAGPGAGKTRVLTTRLARILHESPNDHFRILALTFTTKAADEMRTRVEALLPELSSERSVIGTFHGFCSQILRQHGSHIGIPPDFTIYELHADREALLRDAIRDAQAMGRNFASGDIQWLKAIDTMKARLIVPEKVGTKFRDPHMAEVYQLYEEALRGANVLDFNGLIMEACRLLARVPEVAARLRRTYRYWMIDEFQDTSVAQYWLLRYLAATDFKNMFVVADDDQIIYQWAGASYRQLEQFRSQFTPALIQLVENHRCPPEIVGLANRLVALNTLRSPDKLPTVAARVEPRDALTVHGFDEDLQEQQFLVNAISAIDSDRRGQIVILGRNRFLLEPVLAQLKDQGIPARLWQRRDTFMSAEFVWLYACLAQSLRPTDQRLFATLVNAANRALEIQMDPVVLSLQAEATGLTLLEHWANEVSILLSPRSNALGTLASRFAQSPSHWNAFVREAIPVLVNTADGGESTNGDLVDDHLAWRSCVRDIRAESGQEPTLNELVQGMALRPKDPPASLNEVTLMTIHAAKGLEFDRVYVIGMAEDEMPSWQSVQKGDESAEMEEERRSCFVAITRTRESLTLSFASKYRGRNRVPSRFLREMALI